MASLRETFWFPFHSRNREQLGSVSTHPHHYSWMVAPVWVHLSCFNVNVRIVFQYNRFLIGVSLYRGLVGCSTPKHLAPFKYWRCGCMQINTKSNSGVAWAKAFSWDIANRHGLWSGCSRSLDQCSPDAQSQNKERYGQQEGGAHRSPAAGTLVPKEQMMSGASPSVRSGCQSKSHTIDLVSRCWNYVFVCQVDGVVF